jgi:uncharacterized phage infection (PIP) family protein YhgE
VESSSANMKEINELMPKLNQKYNQIDATIDEEIKKFLFESNKLNEAIYKQ